MCKRYKAKPFKPPIIVSLPEFRINESQPFQNAGIDVFGPLFIRTSIDGRVPKQRRWICIFTCMAILAIHVEVPNNMHSADFLYAFRRFVARRDTPQLIITDNAPQFAVVENATQTLTNNGQIQRYLSKSRLYGKKFHRMHHGWAGIRTPYSNYKKCD